MFWTVTEAVHIHLTCPVSVGQAHLSLTVRAQASSNYKGVAKDTPVGDISQPRTRDNSTYFMAHRS